jgi:hypothetical protein
MHAARSRVAGVPIARGAAGASRSSLGGGAGGSGAGGAAVPPTRDGVFAHAGAVTALAAHPSRRFFASGARDGELALWALGAGEFGEASLALPRVHARAAGGAASPVAAGAAGSGGRYEGVLGTAGGAVGSASIISVAGAVASSDGASVAAAAAPGSGGGGGGGGGGAPCPWWGEWAERGGVTALLCTEEALLSGGADGIVVGTPLIW